MTKYCLVSDDSGHDYVIPSDKRTEWYDFDFSDYDFNLPDYAELVEGGDLDFYSPEYNGKRLFESKPTQGSRAQLQWTQIDTNNKL